MCINRSKIINSSSIFFVLGADTVSLHKKKYFHRFITILSMWYKLYLNIQRLTDHIVEIVMKYIEFQSVQAVILRWSYRLLPEFSVHWIYWGSSIRCFDLSVCRLFTYFSRNSTEFTSITIISEHRNVCEDVQCDYVTKNTTTCSGGDEECDFLGVFRI